jgi:hypothetical protein
VPHHEDVGLFAGELLLHELQKLLVLVQPCMSPPVVGPTTFDAQAQQWTVVGPAQAPTNEPSTVHCWAWASKGQLGRTAQALTHEPSTRNLHSIPPREKRLRLWAPVSDRDTS